MLPVMGILCAIVALEALSAVAPKGYQSQKSREQKDLAALAKSGVPQWIGRLQAAQYNTFEACMYMICSFFIASDLGVPKLLFAKVATLFFLLRVAYIVFYATDLDMFRTQAWLTGFHAMVFLGLAALFPDTVLPMLGEELGKGKK